MKTARLRLQAFIALAVALACLLSAQLAYAAPTEPWMTLTDLRSAIEAAPGGTLPGELKTVLRGSTISTIEVEVLAVTGGPTDDLDPGSALILFEAKGPVIDKIGGIAEGMSGSPIYVTVGGNPYLVGALSYGDVFTTHGTGLATPIEAMSAVEGLRVVEDRFFSEPVVTGDGLKTRVIITNEPKAHADDAKAGAIVASPMASTYVGNANPKSGLYRRFAGRLEKNGMNLIPLSAPLGTSSERFETTFTPGAAVTALVARGDVWVGGIGTVTYVNGNNVVAFGHSLVGIGACDYYLSNAWIDGLWPSTYIPYKLGTPGKLRGTLVEDRNAAIMGVVGDLREDSVVKAYAERTDKGTSASTNVGLPKSVILDNDMWWGIVPYSASVAAWKLYDEYPGGGSALTTTTITVSDGSATYEIVRSNIWDEYWYIADDTAYDADWIVSELQYLNSSSTPLDIKSVEVTSSLTGTHNSAEILDVAVPTGLRGGDNTVTVSIKLNDGSSEVVNVPLSLPTSSSLDGRLIASAPGYYDEEDEYGVPTNGSDFSASSVATIGDAVDDFGKMPTNDEIQVAFVPNDDGSMDEGDYWDMPTGPSSGPSVSYEPSYGSAKTGHYLYGEVEKPTETIEADVYPSVSTYMGESFITCTTSHITSGSVKVYLQYSGETSETLVDTVDIEDADGMGMFGVFLFDLTKNAKVRVVTPATADYMATSKVIDVKVAARQTITASSYRAKRGTRVTLTSRVLPGTVTGNVIFERYVKGHWARLAVRPLTNGVATYRYAPSATSKFRARTSGYPTNAATKSRTITVTIR